MEGKAVLFKKLGYLDSFDIELNTPDPEKFIESCVALEPTFGGINIEDVKAPECFYIEKEVQKRVNIPIMHGMNIYLTHCRRPTWYSYYRWCRVIECPFFSE